MFCFQVRETITKGIEVCRRPPCIPKRGLNVEPLLDHRLMDLIAADEDESFEFFLCHTVPLLRDRSLFFRALCEREDTSRKALVRIETAAGVGGRIRLKATTHKEVKVRDRVCWEWPETFPPVGVEVVGTEDDTVQLCKRLTEGVEDLDVLLVMLPGASIRIERTGDLSDQFGCRARPNISLYWNGVTLDTKPGRAKQGMQSNYSPSSATA